MPDNASLPIRDLLARAPVIPVVRVERVEHAVPMAKALVNGGLPVIEITLRTPPALEAAAAIVREVPEAIVGIGTLTRPEAFSQARDIGARFAVSPGLTPALIEAGRTAGLPFLPGVMTPSEALRAASAGFDALKLFPAEQAGGVGMLKALSGPFPELVFCPTGGISPDNMATYLALPNVACVGGSWLVPSKAVADGNWTLITRLAANAVREASLTSRSPASPGTGSSHEPQSTLGEEDPGAAV